jgi:3D (Asp-Asp-Asp) domain-containing protein
MPVAGITIAGPRTLPFGTRIFIPSVGWRVVQDRTARRYDGRVDVFMKSHRAAKAFGVRREKITIITK